MFDKRALEAMASVTLISGIPHCLFATPVGISPATYLTCAAQLVLLAVAVLKPNRAERLMRSKRAIVLTSICACVGIAGVHLLPADSVACLACMLLLGAAESVWFLYNGLVLSALENKMLPIVAFGGMEASFLFATTVLALPEQFPLIAELFASLTVCQLLQHQITLNLGGGGLDSIAQQPQGQCCRRIRLPLSLIVLIASFSVGMNYLRSGMGPEGNWGSTFALASVLAGVIMIFDFSLFANSLFSILDVSAAIMLAVPLLFLGSGLGCSPLVLSLATIGFFMIAPRYLQWVIEIAREEQGSLFRGLALVYVANAIAQAIGACFFDISAVIPDQRGRFIIAMVIAVGILLCGYIPYNTRALNRMVGYLDIDKTFRDEKTDISRSNSASFEEPVFSNIPEEQATLDEMARLYSLTARERETLFLLACKKSIADMAECLGVSTNTVKSHVLHVHQKLDVHSHEDLVGLIKEHEASHQIDTE